MNTLALVALFQLATPSPITPNISYPTLGYTLAAGHLLRLAGIPGACYSEPDPSPALYLQIQTASAARAVLLSTAGDTPTLLYRTPIADATVSLSDPPLAIAISPTGAYFAALSPLHLWLFRRSGTAPLATFDARSLPTTPHDITALLVGDNGDLILNTTTAFWYSAAPVSPAATFTAVSLPLTFLRFAPRDHLLVAYEPGQGRLIALHPTSGFAIEPLLTPKDSLTPVTGLEFAADSLAIWITQQNGVLIN